MKNFLNILGCIIVVIVAAFVGQAAGFFKIGALDDASRYGSGVVAWAGNGFKGSPTATAPTEPGPAAPSADAVREKAEFAALVGESKKRAIAKYPDIAVAPSEMNSRFVFRYNWMVKEGNALLQDATWPEKLAEDCAKASKVTARTLKSSAVSSKKMVASAGQ